MRVLQVLLRDAVGGAESLANSLDREWAARGHEHAVAYLDVDGASTGRAPRVGRMRRAIRDAAPDVVVTHGALPNLYARLASGRVPVVTVLHSAVDDFAVTELRIAERLLQRRTAAVVAVSDRLAAEYRARFGHAVPVTVIGNGVSPEFAPGPSTGTGTSVVTLARVVPQKDPHTWLGIVAAVAADAAGGARFAWYGPDGDPPWFASAVAALPEGPRARAVFHGPVTDTATPLRDAALLLHTAVAEAQSITLIEAAAAGVPIVCTDDVAATLPEGVPSTSFPSGDVAAGAAAVRRALADLPALARDSRVAAEAVRARYGIGATADAYDAVITAAVAVDRRARRPRR